MYFENDFRTDGLNDRRDIPAKIVSGGVHLRDEDSSLDLYVPEASRPSAMEVAALLRFHERAS